MSKTEAAILAAIETRGYFVGRGRREFTIAARMRDRGALAGFDYKFDAWNAGTHGRYLAAREVYIAKRPAQAVKA